MSFNNVPNLTEEQKKLYNQIANSRVADNKIDESEFENAINQGLITVGTESDRKIVYTYLKMYPKDLLSSRAYDREQYDAKRASMIDGYNKVMDKLKSTVKWVNAKNSEGEMVSYLDMNAPQIANILTPVKCEELKNADANANEILKSAHRPKLKKGQSLPLETQMTIGLQKADLDDHIKFKNGKLTPDLTLNDAKALGVPYRKIASFVRKLAAIDGEKGITPQEMGVAFSFDNDTGEIKAKKSFLSSLVELDLSALSGKEKRVFKDFDDGDGVLNLLEQRNAYDFGSIKGAKYTPSTEIGAFIPSGTIKEQILQRTFGPAKDSNGNVNIQKFANANIATGFVQQKIADIKSTFFDLKANKILRLETLQYNALDRDIGGTIDKAEFIALYKASVFKDRKLNRLAKDSEGYRSSKNLLSWGLVDRLNANGAAYFDKLAKGKKEIELLDLYDYVK